MLNNATFSTMKHNFNIHRDNAIIAIEVICSLSNAKLANTNWLNTELAEYRIG